MTSAIPAAMIPVTVSWAGRQVDLALPAGIPLAEVLPGIVDAMGKLSVSNVSQGFRVLTPSGTPLDQGMSLAQHRVEPGSVLTLEAIGSASGDERYDDLVEAMGSAVESTRVPWQRGDTVQLSGYSSAALLAVAAGMLVFADIEPLTVFVICLVSAMLVALAAAAVARVPAAGPATALVMSACCLAGVAGFRFMPSATLETRTMFAGLGVLVASAAAAVLPEKLRPAVAGPLVAGLSLGGYGALTSLARLPAQQAAASIVTVLTVATLLAAWIGLAQVPVRVEGLSVASTNRLDGEVVAKQVGAGGTLMLAVRVSAGIVTVAATPLVASTPVGGVFMLCVGVALMLGTRSLFGRYEVLTGSIAGMVTVALTGLVTTTVRPEFMPVAIGTALGAAALVLANNVIAAKLRPGLTRVVDGLQIVALIALLPLAAMVWGVF